MDRNGSYQDILDRIKEAYEVILKDNLIGIYVHGSICLGCFHWDKSDIDYLVVVKDKPSDEEKLQLMEITVKLNEAAPAKGIEMSVVLLGHCRNFVYPTPFELHFSNTHIDWFRQDPQGYIERMNGLDKDLAAHFTITRRAGIVLCGWPIAEVFGDVPKEDYIDSIREDVKETRNAIAEQPMYVILTLPRVLAYLQSGLVLSKELAGEWAIRNLDSRYRTLIQKALHSYGSGEELQIDQKVAEDYCDALLQQIFPEEDKL